MRTVRALLLPDSVELDGLAVRQKVLDRLLVLELHDAILGVGRARRPAGELPALRRLELAGGELRRLAVFERLNPVEALRHE